MFQTWNAETGSAVGKPLEGHSHTVSSVTHSPDGRHIIPGSFDKTFRTWEAKTWSGVGKALKGHTGHVRSVAYSPDGRHIVSGSSDEMIRIWGPGTESSIASPPSTTHQISPPFYICTPRHRGLGQGPRRRLTIYIGYRLTLA